MKEPRHRAEVPFHKVIGRDDLNRAHSGSTCPNYMPGDPMRGRVVTCRTCLARHRGRPRHAVWFAARFR